MVTVCQLRARKVGSDVTETAAWGQVHPPSEGQMVHNCPLGKGFARVNVDDVLEGFGEIELPIPPNEEMVTLSDARGSFIQWPKLDILLVGQPTKPVLTDLSPTTCTPKIKEAPTIQAAAEETQETSTPTSVAAKTRVQVDFPTPANNTMEPPLPSPKIPETSTPPAPVQAKAPTPPIVHKATEIKETTPASAAAKTGVLVDKPTPNNMTKDSSEQPPLAPKKAETPPPAPKKAPTPASSVPKPPAVVEAAKAPTPTCVSSTTPAAAQPAIPTTRTTRSSQVLPNTAQTLPPPAAKAKPVTKPKGKKAAAQKQPIPPPDATKLTGKALQDFYNAGGRLPEATIHPTYKAGEKLIHNAASVTSEYGWACASLQNYYLNNFKKPEKDQVSGFMVRYKPEIFLNDGLCEFLVTWEDLFLLFNLKSFDASIVTCSTL